MSSSDKKDVLIVDDDDSIRTLLRRVLERLELTCDTAVDGEDALAKIEQQQYSVVLSDLMMPRVDGAELARRLAVMERESAERTVVLIMTAYPQSERLTSLADTVQAVVRKPFDVDELSEVVRACVHAQRGPSSPRSRNGVSAFRIAPRITSMS